MTQEMKGWNLAHNNKISVNVGKECLIVDLNTFQRCAGNGKSGGVMTPEEVNIVFPILVKCGWPFDPNQALVLTSDAKGNTVAVTLQPNNEWTITKVLWEAPKPAPAVVVVSTDEAPELDAGNLALSSFSKPHPRQIQFSVNSYDADGDCQEKGVFLWFGNTRVCVAETPLEFINCMPAHMEKIAQELMENYNLRTGRPL